MYTKIEKLLIVSVCVSVVTLSIAAFTGPAISGQTMLSYKITGDTNITVGQIDNVYQVYKGERL